MSVPVEVLHLSVRAENRLLAAGVRTVDDVRKLDPDALKRIGLGAKFHAKAIAKALARYDGRMKAAREAMLELASEERAEIHAEVGCCACADVGEALDAAGKALARNPDVAVGALAGGLLAVALRKVPRPRELEPPSKPALPQAELHALLGSK